MPSLILTTRCPNTCAWCFARAKMKHYSGRGIFEFDWDTFVRAVDFFERSSEACVNLLGGEPLLHSRIVDILGYLRERGFMINIGTTGVVPSSLVNRLAGMHFQNILFGVNSTSYFSYGPRKRAKVDYFLRNIGHPTGISYTLTERDLASKDPFPILDRLAMITRFSLRRNVTLQVAAPAERNRDFVPFECCGDAADIAADWIRILGKNRITCSLDCHSIPECRYPGGHPLASTLRPICRSFPLDIGPDLDIWPCFPLAHMGVPLERFRDFSSVRKHFAEILRGRDLHFDETCGDCRAPAEGKCHGGCLGFQTLRENRNRPHLPARREAVNP